MLSIFTLGGLGFVQDEKAISTIGSQKAKAALVYLAVESRPVHRQVLATLLWPNSSHTKALSSLRVVLSVLRKHFSDHLRVTRDIVELKRDDQIFVDIDDVERKIAKGEIKQALALWKGDFLEGFTIADSEIFEDWRNYKGTRIRELLINGLKGAVSIAISTEDISYGLELIHQILKMDPIDEEAHRQCMTLLCLNNNKNMALSQYEDCKSILKEELGIFPSKETQMLYERILNDDLLGFGKNIPDNNLPAKQSIFIGRAFELYEINQMFHNNDIKIISIIGPGGCGKTKLAIEVGKMAFPLFKDGIFFVSLGDLMDINLLIPAIAKAIKFNIDTIATQLDPEEQLIDYLYHRQILIICDGVDALTSHSEKFSKLSTKLPEMKILLTSRQPLKSSDEWIYHLTGLQTENPRDPQDMHQVDSMKLFITRARQIDPHFTPSTSEFSVIGQICKTVEGMPLAIEMAAAWTAMLTVEEIEREISSNLDFLVTRFRDVDEKHRSIRAVFDSSWNLLTPQQQQNLSKIAIFQGNFDLNAIIKIADLSINDVLELVEKSLIERIQTDRFNLHPLIRQFALDKLSEDHERYLEIQDRYCFYYLNMLNDSVENLMNQKMLKMREQLSKDLHHIFTAAKWAILYYGFEVSHQILTSLIVFFAVHGWHEGLEMFRILEKERTKEIKRKKIEDPLADPVVLICRVHQGFLLSNLGQITESEEVSKPCAKPLYQLNLTSEYSECLHNLGVNASFRGDFETAQQLLEDAVMIGRDAQCLLWPTYLLWLGHLYFLIGEYERGMVGLEKCRDIFMEQGTFWGAAFAISKMGLAAEGLGANEQAFAYHHQAYEIFKDLQNDAGKGYSLSRMSMSAYFLKRYDLALQYSTEACEIFEKLSHRWGLSSSLIRTGFAHLELDSIKSAKEKFLDALEISQDNQMAPLILYALAGIACVLMSEGKCSSAVELFAYLRHHPKVVRVYLQQATCWFDHNDLSLAGIVDTPINSKLTSKNLTDLKSHYINEMRAETKLNVE